jgi:hypothetical protein
VYSYDFSHRPFSFFSSFFATINSTLACLDRAIAEKAGNMNKPMPICCEFIVMHLHFLGPTIVYWAFGIIVWLLD